MMIISVGPELVSLTGPETVTAGERGTFSCSSQESNPASNIQWTLTSEQGEVGHLLTISDLSTTNTQHGWTTISSAEVSVPRSESLLGLKVICTITNPQLEQEIVKEQSVTVLCKSGHENCVVTLYQFQLARQTCQSPVRLGRGRARRSLWSVTLPPAVLPPRSHGSCRSRPPPYSRRRRYTRQTTAASPRSP